MNADERRQLELLIQAFYRLQDAHPTMTVNEAIVFCLAVQREGRFMDELRRLANVSDAAAISRIIGTLGRGKARDVPGLNLVETRESPVHRSRKEVYLTDRGRELAKRVLGNRGAIAKPPELSEAISLEIA